MFFYSDGQRIGDDWSFEERTLGRSEPGESHNQEDLLRFCGTTIELIDLVAPESTQSTGPPSRGDLVVPVLREAPVSVPGPSPRGSTVLVFVT